jgi:hypothetical protein
MTFPLSLLIPSAIGMTNFKACFYVKVSGDGVFFGFPRIAQKIARQRSVTISSLVRFVHFFHFRLSGTKVSSMVTRESYEQEQDVPSCSTVDRFRCSLTRKIMKEPVTSKHGYHFEQKTIMKWIKRRGETCPISGQPLKVSDLKPNSMLQWEIMFWQRKNEQDAVVEDHVLSRRSAPLLLQEPPRKVDAPPVTVIRSPEVPTRKQRALSADTPLSLSDTPPSVPRRKYSDVDLPSLCDMMRINKYDVYGAAGAIESSHRNIVTPPDILRTHLSLADTVVPLAPQMDFASPVQAQGIVFFLDEVEISLIFDGL